MELTLDPEVSEPLGTNILRGCCRWGPLMSKSVCKTVGGRFEVQPSNCPLATRDTSFVCPLVDVLANAVRLVGESSPLSAATLTCTRQCAPRSVHRICCFFAIRWLTTRFTADSAMLLLSC